MARNGKIGAKHYNSAELCQRPQSPTEQPVRRYTNLTTPLLDRSFKGIFRRREQDSRRMRRGKRLFET